MVDLNYNIKISDEPEEPQPKQQLNFNNNPTSETKITDQSEPIKRPTGLCAFLSIEYYQPFFDVNSQEVGKRLMLAFVPTQPKFFEIAKKNPDLYGPFWIYTTLIFMIAVAGNFSGYIRSSDSSKFQYQFNFVPMAAGLIYGFGFIVPLIITVMMKFFGTAIEYSQVICIYGYSMACFIPVTVFCIVPHSSFQWLFLIYGITNSTAFLMINFWKELGNYIDKKRYFVIGFIAGAQLVMILFFKFYFFGNIFETTQPAKL